jgi:alpha-methylacyl-CoA racemase
VGVLSGIRILEFEGVGPGPFCGMLLADLGAEVILVEKDERLRDKATDNGDAAIERRGKRSIVLNLKSHEDRAIALDLIGTCDALVEGMRPGVMERLGLGPDLCLGINPKLVFGRITGWGQNGPLAHSAGHDINYLGLSGASWFAGPRGRPFVPPSLIGDIAGGALYMTIGLLAGILDAKRTGVGQVIDAAIVDGSAHMMNLCLSFVASGKASMELGDSFLNGAPWYDSYSCSDGRSVSIGAIESRFYGELIQILGLRDEEAFTDQNDKSRWPEQRKTLSEVFLSATSFDWAERLEGSDTCFSLILSPEEASRHEHIKSRSIYQSPNGVLQASPAPRFSKYPSHSLHSSPIRGGDSRAICDELSNFAHERARRRVL